MPPTASVDRESLILKAASAIGETEGGESAETESAAPPKERENKRAREVRKNCMRDSRESGGLSRQPERSVIE
jgi:hypothetical protein